MARGLSKEGIVDAALELLDEKGLGGLTVRALADKLGVKAPALYWHIPGKAEMVDEMSTEIWRRVGRELDALPPDIPWDDEMRSFAAIVRRAFLSHRDGARVFSGTYLTDPGVLERQETGLERWLAQGFELDDVIRAFELLYNFVVGFCIEEQGRRQEPDAGRYTVERRRSRIDAEAHPLVAESSGPILSDADARFDAQVDILVDAVGRLRRPAGWASGT
jgi:AcrR family transcriptional regulator